MELPVRKELFWDVNINNLDMILHKRLIIERVFTLGNLKEFRTIMEYYGRETVREEIKNVGYLDPKTFEFAVNFLKIPKKEMKCYILKQSRQQHWT
jgi:transcriptional accessory protein Tex/SPT6